MFIIDTVLFGPPGTSDLDDEDEMPRALKSQLEELEFWAQVNLRESKQDTVNFWLLKVPAILGSAFAGIFAYFKLDVVALLVGAVGSFCVLIDGLYPRGTLRNTHLRAYHDLRSLQQTMIMQWRTGSLKITGEPREINVLAATIIDGTQEEVKRIRDYIKDAETALDAKNRIQ